MAFINSIMEDEFRCFLFYACNPRGKKELKLTATTKHEVIRKTIRPRSKAYKKVDLKSLVSKPPLNILQHRAHR